MTPDIREARRRAVQWMRANAGYHTHGRRLDVASLACDCEHSLEGAPPLHWLEEAAEFVAWLLDLEVRA